MTLKTNEISNEKMSKVFKLYIKLYNKEPNNYNELLQFHNLMSEIIKTFDIPYEQITKKHIIEYNELIND